MTERSCSIPLVVRLRGTPDEGRLAGMSETVRRTVADRLSEAARVIRGREGWTSYRETHALPVIRFSGGPLDANLQRRVAAAIEAGIAGAVSSQSPAAKGSAPLPLLAVPEFHAVPDAARPPLDPRETETGWYFNRIPVFTIQRSGGSAENGDLNIQPALSTNGEGGTRLHITVAHDANISVLLQPDAISQLTRLASEIDIQDVVTVAAPEDRSFAPGARPATETPPATPISQPAAAPPSATGPELQQAIEVAASASADAIAYPQFAPSRLPSPRHGSGNIEEAAGIRATEPNIFGDQRERSLSPSLGARRDPDTRPQLPDAPGSNERHNLAQPARYDPANPPFPEVPEIGRIVGTPFDRITPDRTFGNEQQRVERVVVIQSRTLLTEEEFAAGVERARGPGGLILPYKGTRAEAAELSPIYASRLSGSRVLVCLRHDIFATGYAADRDLRLPPAICKGVELDETDVVGVKFIDQGVLSFVPAMLLVYLRNDATRAALINAGEVLASGPAPESRPQPGAAESGDAVTTEIRVDTTGTTGLASADRVTVDPKLADSRPREHRERIIATSPDTGAFVDAMVQPTNVEGIAKTGKATEGLSRSFETAESAARPGPNSTLASEQMNTPPEQPGTEAEPTSPAVGAEVVVDHGKIEVGVAESDRRPTRPDDSLK